MTFPNPLGLQHHGGIPSNMPAKAYHTPNHTYALSLLETITAPPAPKNFAQFWQAAYADVLKIHPKIEVQDTGKIVNHWRVLDVYYHSTNNMKIGGWLLVPAHQAPTRAFVVGHGYAGRDGPDFNLPFPDAAIFFPCCRGLGRSPNSPISSEPHWHVLHNIDKRDEYIIKGCVEDIWLAVSGLLSLFPYLAGHLGFLGISFTGGIGVLAMAWEQRVSRAHFNVPTFGHHRLRLRQATWGSGHAIQIFYQQHPKITLSTLRYYDAANAAEYLTMPVHFALALKDPVVTPPGQFAIYNHTPGNKQLFVLDEGHASYARQHEQDKQLLQGLAIFFENL